MATRARKIVIMGGRGGMGKLFTRLWRDQGHHVTALGRNNYDAKKHLLADADLAIVSVPISATTDTIKRMAADIGPNTVLTDFTSIKQQPLDAMLKHHKGPVIGLHPVFGPSVKSLSKQVVVTCPGRDGRKSAWIGTSLRKAGLTVKKLSADKHDQTMSIVQALKHFSAYSLGQFLYDQDVDLKETLALSSPIYRLELDMLGRIFSQSPELYADIIMSDKKRIKLIEEFVKTVTTLLKDIKRQDKTAFIKNFQTIADWMGPFAKSAMKESDKVINHLK